MTNQADDGAANHVEGAGTAATGRLHDAAGAVRDAAGAAKSAAGDAYATARDKVGDVLEVAREKSGAAYSGARDRSADAYDSAREKASEAYSAAREKASQARQATGETIEDNPLAAVIGGIALGVLVGALLPRTQREADALGPIASRLTDTAKAAAAAAREAGRQKLDEMGINKDAAFGQVEKLVDTAVQAVTSAGTAAADAVRQP